MKIHEATWEEIARHNMNFVKKNYGIMPIIISEQEHYIPIKSPIRELPRTLGGIPTGASVNISSDAVSHDSEMINYGTRVEWKIDENGAPDTILFRSRTALSTRSDIRPIQEFAIAADIIDFDNTAGSSIEIEAFRSVEGLDLTERPHYRGPSGLLLASLLEVFAITTDFK